MFFFVLFCCCIFASPTRSSSLSRPACPETFLPSPEEEEEEEEEVDGRRTGSLSRSRLTNCSSLSLLERVEKVPTSIFYFDSHDSRPGGALGCTATGERGRRWAAAAAAIDRSSAGKKKGQEVQEARTPFCSCAATWTTETETEIPLADTQQPVAMRTAETGIPDGSVTWDDGV